MNMHDSHHVSQSFELIPFVSLIRFRALLQCTIQNGVLCGVLYQKQISRAGRSNYTPQYMWDVITCPWAWCLLLAQHFSYICVVSLYSISYRLCKQFALSWLTLFWRIQVNYLPIFFKTDSLASEKLDDCHNMNKVLLKHKGKIKLYQIRINHAAEHESCVFFVGINRKACTIHDYALSVKQPQRQRHQTEPFFYVTGPFCGEFTVYWWIPLTKASNT